LSFARFERPNDDQAVRAIDFSLTQKQVSSLALDLLVLKLVGLF
jgi:hypothetical protein